MKYALIALLVLLLGALIAAIEYFFRFAVLRKKEPKKTQKSMSESKGLMSLVPFKEQMRLGEEWLNAQSYEEVSITSHDGLKLYGRFMNNGAKRTLILFHGYRSRAFRDFSCVGEYYKNLGFNLLFVDQRAHGKSEGKYITFGVRERLDCVKWAEYADEHIGGEIFLDGISMGASTVLMASGEKLPASVRGILADCGFTSPKEIMLKVMEVDLKVKCRPLFYLISWVVRLRAGFGINECSTIDALKKNKLPVLFIHGTGDKFVPCEMTERAYAACTAEKVLVLVEGAGHGASYLEDEARCKAALSEFLSKYSEE